ncbi:hypothetical protein S7711_04477 [Stachybotrys chartarum IBT 7711]|uniref:Alpha/beta hydrolase fold-3 domain-containing protein n=1 Tax=Stachybotrys chartarum (strain CBS 109288 / IBT 7711) TaxID=1280523 RepID=A0A084BA60_STACB|nr:hypothetical protein S7711_04477 [Stachybotrys chartarum IBT 7711]
MVKFSQYDGGGEEWYAVSAAAPPLDIPPITKPVERKMIFNELIGKSSAAAMNAFSAKIRIQNFTFSTRDGTILDARSYRPVAANDDRLPVFYYIHGGGYLTGNLNIDDPTCSGFALGANVVVVHANYRHTPEFTYPTAWHDSEDGFLWLHDHMDEFGGIPESVVVGGISAGGHLAASLTLQKHLGNIAPSLPPIAGQVLMVPVLSHLETRLAQLAKSEESHLSSYESNKNANMLSLAEWRATLDLLKIPDPDPRDLRINIMNATLEEVKGLPPTTIGVCGLDILRDDGLEYGKLLAEAGVPTEVHMFRGMPHFFRGFGDKISQSKRWDAVIEHGVKWPLTAPNGTGQFIIKEKQDWT